MIPTPPKPPHSRIIREGTIGDCPICKSTTKKKYIFFGKTLGCINPSCENYLYNKIYKIQKNDIVYCKKSCISKLSLKTEVGKYYLIKGIGKIQFISQHLIKQMYY